MTSVQRLFNNIKKLIPNYFDDSVGYTKQELEDFEKTLGFKLPDVVKEFYGASKMYENLGYSWSFLGMGVSDGGLCNIYSSHNNKIKAGDEIINRMVIGGDGAGSDMYLDFDPDTEGTIGQVIVTFREYHEVFFFISQSFDEFLDFVSEQFETNKVTMFERQFCFELKISNGGQNYVHWVDLSHKNTPKNASNRLVNLSEVWQKSLRDNSDFLDKPLSEMLESDLDRIYYVDLFEENLDSIEVLALFPNIAKISIRYISTDILEILAKTRVAMLNVYVEIIDFQQLVPLKHLVDMTISCKTIENIEYLSEFKHLKYLAIKADFTSELEKFYQNYKETNNISEGFYAFLLRSWSL